MRSNVSISGIRLGRHCHETLLLMVALSDVCTFSYPPDGSPVRAGSEGSLYAPLSETRSGFQILTCVARITSSSQDEAREKVASSEYSDTLLNTL